ncbi:MAG: glycoside hydrolase family 3 protein [Calditrichia bacterium]
MKARKSSHHFRNEGELIPMREFDHNISALLEKMNLDQKVGQIVQPERQFITPQEVKDYHIGSVLSGGGSVPGENRPQDWVRMNDAYWAASMEEDADHLAIPVIYGIDAIHGNTNVKGAVVFPHNIGLGAARDPGLIERIAVVTAREIAATGLDWTFAPAVSVARNDHWGRTYESYAEDPEIVAAYAGKFVSGLQGEFGPENVIACVKHWAGDGATGHGIDQGDACISEAELRRIHIPPYRAAIQAGVLTVMVSLNSWNGIKCHGHRYLITEVLKNELGFKGMVVSDWDGIDYLSEDFAEAAAIAMNAGLDMFMVTEKWKQFIQIVKKHIEDGNILMSRLDDAVERILRVKFQAGMFTKPRPAQRRLAKSSGSFGSQAHREIAREAVRKSLVLLKNQEGILPLDKNARILVAGKNAHNRGHQCGGFTIAWQGVNNNEAIIGGSSIWEGIRAVAHNAELSADLTGSEADAQKHEVGIVVIGELPYAEMMGDLRIPGLYKSRKVQDKSAASGETGAAQGTVDAHSRYQMSYHASQSLAAVFTNNEMVKQGPYGTHLYLHELHPEDVTAIRNIADKGIPVVAVLVCGRPLVVNQELEASRAFVVAWLPGSEGQGVADVLFGDFDFQGKLSFSWPRYDDENWNIGDAGYNPLFPYGFGLTFHRQS